jgi:hypothetical protein
VYRSLRVGAVVIQARKVPDYLPFHLDRTRRASRGSLDQVVLHHRQLAHAPDRRDVTVPRLGRSLGLEVEHDGMTHLHSGGVGKSVREGTTEITLDLVATHRCEGFLPALKPFREGDHPMRKRRIDLDHIDPLETRRKRRGIQISADRQAGDTRGVSQLPQGPDGFVDPRCGNVVLEIEQPGLESRAGRHLG